MLTNWQIPPASTRRSVDSEAPPQDVDWTPRPSFSSSTTRIAENPSGPSPAPDAGTTSSKRLGGLGYLADKLAPLHLHHHQHSPSKNPSPGAGSTSFVDGQMNASAAAAKSHTSPSKPSYGRTYDSTFVSREMHRLAHLPAALAPSLGSSPSSAPSVGSTSALSLSSQSAMNDPWGTLHVHVLPLFNAEPLRVPIEELNILVRRHVGNVVPSEPKRALTKLETDASELIGNGMLTLHAKLADLKDEKLIGRVVETWGFFWDQVLPYVEGVLLPLQTDPLLSSVYRAPKPQRSTSPGGHNAKTSISSSSQLGVSGSYIDVRTVALRSFRDKVILPFAPRLAKLLKETAQDPTYQQPRLQQMLLVLASQTRQPLPTFSLTEPVPEPTPGEAAVNNLLRLVRSPNVKTQHYSRRRTTHAPTFLSGGAPRDRRGRINAKNMEALFDEERTPTVRLVAPGDPEKGREREYLEALRSPDPELMTTTATARASVGWGLGVEEVGKMDEEDEEYPSDWDQAQAVVERMVGMKPNDKV